MKFKKLGKVLLMMGLATCMSFSMFACGTGDGSGTGGGASNVEGTPTKLDDVSVSIDGANVTWAAVEGATGYEYSFDGGKTFTLTTELSLTLTEGQSVIIRAAGDGVNTRHGDWSESVSYGDVISGGGEQGGTETPDDGEQGGTETPDTPVKLAKLTVTIDENGVATWEEVQGAVKYEYSWDRGFTVHGSVTETSLQLTDGKAVVVRAVGDGTNYLTGDWSIEKIYNAPAPELDTLATPEVELDGNVASWGAVENASGYVYKINDGAEQSTNATEIPLNNGETLVVKAKGDNVTYSDSAWSTAVTFNKVALATPQASITVNVVSWTEIEGATGYIVYVNGTPNEVSKTTLTYTLESTATVKVVAKGDGVLHSNSAESNEVSWTKPINQLVAPNVTITGRTVSWEAVPNASGYIVNVNGVDMAQQSAVTYVLTDSASVKVKAVGDGVDYATSDWSNVKVYTQTVVNNCEAYGQASQVQFWVETNATTSLDTTVKTQGTYSIKTVGNAWNYINVYMRDSGDQPIPNATLATYDYISIDIYNANATEVKVYFKDAGGDNGLGTNGTVACTLAAKAWTTVTFDSATITQWFGNGYCTFYLMTDNCTLYFDNVCGCTVR